MHARLLEIIAEKKREVARLKREGLSLSKRTPPPLRRDFGSAISRPGRIQLIAEIKFASPSAGQIREPTDPARIGQAYERAGAAAISVLTDQTFFGGRLDDLPKVKGAVDLPILRKDFIIDELQIRETHAWGADALLLIVRILSESQLKEFLDSCREKGLAALVEVHDLLDLEKALKADAEIIGINNRDLDSFTIRLETTRELAAAVPPGRILVSESGFQTPAEIQNLKGMGIHAVLVGSSLMQAEDLEAKTREMVEAGKWSE